MRHLCAKRCEKLLRLVIINRLHDDSSLDEVGLRDDSSTDAVGLHDRSSTDAVGLSHFNRGESRDGSAKNKGHTCIQNKML